MHEVVRAFIVVCGLSFLFAAIVSCETNVMFEGHFCVLFISVVNGVI